MPVDGAPYVKPPNLSSSATASTKLLRLLSKPVFVQGIRTVVLKLIQLCDCCRLLCSIAYNHRLQLSTQALSLPRLLPDQCSVRTPPKV